MKLRRILQVFLLLAIFVFPVEGNAKTYRVDGEMKSRIKVLFRKTYKPVGSVKELTLQYVRYPDLSRGPNRQKIISEKDTYSMKPKKVTEAKDPYGNTVIRATFRKIPPEGVIHERIVIADLQVNPGLSLESVPYPPKNLEPSLDLYLKPTKLVQSEDSRIQELAQSIIYESKASTYQQVVTAIMNFVVENLRGVVSPPGRDALWALSNLRGNCQGFSHLGSALLRAAGIPARVAVGIATKKPWKYEVPGGYLTLDNAQGLHAWMEVYYPAQGWIPADPQQTQNMISSRLLTQGFGPDASSVVARAEYLGSGTIKRQDYLEVDFLRDDLGLKSLDVASSPQRSLVTNGFLKSRPPKKPPPTAVPRKKPDFAVLREVRQMDKKIIRAEQQQLVRKGFLGFTAKDPMKDDVFSQEMDVYATSEKMYAQKFTVPVDFSLESVALAVCKFGGDDGALWVEVREDRNSKPGMRDFDVASSRPVDISKIKFDSTYPWLVFRGFAGRKTIPLKKGSYWIVLRYQGDAIFNWRCQMGNFYGDGTDTLAGNIKKPAWDEVVNVDLNFKVSGTPR